MAYQRHSLGGVGSVISATAAVVEDPCLLPVSELLLELHRLAQAPARPRAPGQPAPAPSAPAKGIGLCQAVKPLRAAVWVRRRPWVLPVAGVAVVGGLIGLGYLLRGRGR